MFIFFQKEQQFLKGETERLQKKSDVKQQGERVLRASGNSTVEDNNIEEHELLVEKLKEEVFLQESKVVQLESELKGIKNARRSQSFIPRPPGSAAGKRTDPRRPYSGSR